MAISVDEPDVSAAFADELGLHFPLLSDADLSVATAWGVAMEGRDIAIPAVFVVDREGLIRFRKIGEDAADRASPDEILAELARARVPAGD